MFSVADRGQWCLGHGLQADARHVLGDGLPARHVDFRRLLDHGAVDHGSQHVGRAGHADEKAARCLVARLVVAACAVREIKFFARGSGRWACFRYRRGCRSCFGSRLLRALLGTTD